MSTSNPSTRWAPCHDDHDAFTRPLHPVEERLNMGRILAEDKGGILISARATLSLKDNELNESELVSRLMQAWIALRVKCPILGVQTRNEQPPCPSRLYFRHVQDDEEMQTWAKQTTRVFHLSSPSDPSRVLQFRDEMSNHHLPDENNNGAQMWFLLPKGYQQGKADQQIVVTIRLNHTLTDGGAVPMILSEYLQLLDEGELFELSQSIPWQDESFKKQQEERLPSYLDDDALRIRGRKDAALEQYHEKIMSLSETNLKLRSLTPSPTAMQEIKTSRHSRISFSVGESNAFSKYAKSKQTTISPLLAALIQVRLALDHGLEWPVLHDRTHSYFFSINARPALKDPHRLGMAMAAHGTIMSIGQALHPFKTKAQVENDLEPIVLDLARQVERSFHDCKDVQFRANLTEMAPQLFQKWADWAVQDKYNRSAISSLFYSDGKLDDSFPKTFHTFDLVDYDIDGHNTDPVLLFRSRLFRGRTSLAVSWCDAFWPQDYGDRILSQVKEDALKLIQRANL